MLFHLFLFFFLLIILFAVSKKISSRIYFLFFLLTNSQKVSIAILSLLLLPGTIVHELSHFLLASFFRVPTGELSVIPTIDEKTGEVKAGKLMLGETDPFRHILIGLAPLVVGILLIYIIGRIFFPSYFQPTTYNLQPITFIGIYLLFVVSATMFSSKKDMESLKVVLPVTLLIVITLYFIGVRISLAEPMFKKAGEWLTELNGYLLICAVVNFSAFLFLVLNLNLWSRFLETKNRGSSIH